MESPFQKWVNISYLFVAVLLGYIVFSVGLRVSGTFDLEAHFKNVELMIRGISILAGGLLFLILYRHEQANQFMNEVVAELSRVSWPTQKETSSATFIVIVMVLISGLILGLLDSGLEYFWRRLFS